MVDDCIGAVSTAQLPDDMVRRVVQGVLEAEGLPVLQRWTYLLVGGANEDEARALAERLQEEAPEGTTVHVEASGEMVAQVKPANPFAVFGGLADV